VNSSKDPERIVDFESSQGFTGFLVVDRLIGKRSQGGLRVIPDPSLAETAAMARTMTNKYAFVGQQTGGAKAAVQLPPDVTGEPRKRVLQEFGAHVGELIRSGAWAPALDMGCTPDDLKHVYEGAGVPSPTDDRRSRHRSHLYTAWSVYLSTLAALRLIGKPLGECRFAVEGFGKVGSEYSKMLCGAGATLIGTSNRIGEMVDPDGLDLDTMLELRAKHGDRFITQYPEGHRTEAGPIMVLDADIVVPAARAWSVNEGNVDEVRAAVIPCAANVAMVPEIEARLLARGSIAITDYVANCGGVFGSMVDRYVGDEWIYGHLEDRFFPRVYGFLERSQASGRTVAELAGEEVAAKLAVSERAGGASPSRFEGLAKAMLRRAPNAAVEPVFRRYAANRFFT
jgi:glutamate dehydrogenase (NAD(P)+)